MIRCQIALVVVGSCQNIDKIFFEVFFCIVEEWRRVMKLRSQLMDEADMSRALKRMAHEISEHNHGCQNVVFLGIKRRGVPLAIEMAKHINEFENIEVPVGTIDITLYRDDLSEISSRPVISESYIPFDLAKKHVVMVDDVLYTGRTARAALDAISNIGRAATIQFAVLIDRGHRELPIRPDYVGKNVPTSKNEIVSVQIGEFDGQTCVNLYEINS